MNSDLFNTYLEEFLLPVLTKGQLVIMDNAPFHHSLETRRLREEKGCQLRFLPAYSPELNPIEQIWAIFKRYVRRFRTDF
jgi:transposase